MPFAFAIAAMATGRLGEGWLVETRRWTLIAWGALTIGIGLGALLRDDAVGCDPGGPQELGELAQRLLEVLAGGGEGVSSDSAARATHEIAVLRQRN